METGNLKSLVNTLAAEVSSQKGKEIRVSFAVIEIVRTFASPK